MDPQTTWIYSEFLNVYKDYTFYLQQIAILLISAISIILFQNLKEEKAIFWVPICFAFFFGIVCLVYGLFTGAFHD